MAFPVGTDMNLKGAVELTDAGCIDYAGKTACLFNPHHCQLCDAYVGEILRTEPEKFPEERIDGSEMELMAEILIFVSQLLQIGVGGDAGMIDFRNHTAGKKSCLPEEEGFYLEEVVAVLADGGHGNGVCPRLEGIAVDAESEVAGYGDEECVFPVVVAPGKPVINLPGTVLEPFYLKGGQPVVDEERGNVVKDFLAGWSGMGCQQVVVVVAHVVGNGQQELGNRGAIGRRYRAVVGSYYMKDDIVVDWIGTVAMEMPVGCLEMDFHISYPGYSCNPDSRIEEIGTRVGVVETWIDDFNRATIGCEQFLQWENLVFPHIM